MHTALKIGTIAVLLSVAPVVAKAGRLEGVGIGAGAGAIVAGPPGAVVGGLFGYVVGGPNIVRHHRTCWRTYRGYRRCSWY